MSLPRYTDWDLVRAQSGVAIGESLTVLPFLLAIAGDSRTIPMQDKTGISDR